MFMCVCISTICAMVMAPSMAFSARSFRGRINMLWVFFGYFKGITIYTHVGFGQFTWNVKQYVKTQISCGGL